MTETSTPLLQVPADLGETLELQHRVRFTIERGAWVRGFIECTAPEGALCRMTCPDGTCEEWGDECEHGALAPRARGCNAAEWIEDAEGVLEAFDGPDSDLRPGPVKVFWAGDGYAWAYPDEAATR